MGIRNLQQAQCFLVSDDGAVGMQLQDGCGNLGVNGAGEHSLDSLSLVLAVDNHQDLLSLHDAPDAHGVCLAGNIVTACEETLVRIDGGLSQLDTVGAGDENFIRLVEADVAVGAHAQQLQVGVQLADQLVIVATLSLGVLGQTAGDVAVSLVDVHMIEQVGTHEVSVGLVMVLAEAHVLVQVDSLNLGEVQLASFILLDQFLVGADGAGAGCQAQNAVGLQGDDGSDDIASLDADISIIFCADQFHNKVTPFMLLNLF